MTTQIMVIAELDTIDPIKETDLELISLDMSQLIHKRSLVKYESKKEIINEKKG